MKSAKTRYGECGGHVSQVSIQTGYGFEPAGKREGAAADEKGPKSVELHNTGYGVLQQNDKLLIMLILWPFCGHLQQGL